METLGSFLCYQILLLCHRPDESSPHYTNLFIQDPFQYFLPRITMSLKRSLLWKFRTYILCANYPVLSS